MYVVGAIGTQYAVSEVCKAAGIPGYCTNHLFRATCATRLFAAGADEQHKMEHTQHCSVEGISEEHHSTNQAHTFGRFHFSGF